jgi:hypothetical protein
MDANKPVIIRPISSKIPTDTGIIALIDQRKGIIIKILGNFLSVNISKPKVNTVTGQGVSPKGGD